MINMGKQNDIINPIIYEDLQYMYNCSFINWEKLRDKTVFVTGANGMIASYLVYMFIFLNEMEQKYNIKIIVMCRDENKLLTKFGEYIKREYFIVYKGELTNEIGMKNHKADYIIHAASPAGTEQFLSNPVGVIIPNTIGTYNLLEYSKDNKIDGFLFMSSNSIYGVNSGENEILESDYGIVDPLNERACYIESKRLAEQMCNAYARQYGLHTKIARISHTYGPTLDIHNDKRVISRICCNLLANENIVLFKDESAKVQYSYITDVISGCFKILLDGADGEAYNVCSDEFLSMHIITETIISLFPESRSDIIYKDITKEYVFGQGKGINNLKCSNNKLKKLGWELKFPLVDGFKRTIQSWQF